MNFSILCDDISSNKEQFDKIHADPDLYGGSTVANICGLGYQSPLEVWLRRTGKQDDFQVNAQMKLGSYLEDFVRQQFAEKTGFIVHPVNQIWQSVERPWMIASIDAFIPYIESDKLVEIKTGRSWSANGWSDKSASDSAMCQLQWYLAVGGQQGGYCVGMFGGDAENIFHPYFESDKDIQAQLIERVEQFREFVKKDIPPAAGPGDAELIKKHLLRGITKQKEIDLTETHMEIVKELLDVQEALFFASPEVKKLEEKQKALKNQLLQACDGAEIVKIGSNIIYINEVKREAYTVQPSSYYTVKMKKEK